jgi:hypothetical protein
MNFELAVLLLSDALFLISFTFFFIKFSVFEVPLLVPIFIVSFLALVALTLIFRKEHGQRKK